MNRVNACKTIKSDVFKKLALIRACCAPDLNRCLATSLGSPVMAMHSLLLRDSMDMQ